MEWRFSDWKEPSIVEIILRDPEEDETDVYLTQTKIPASEKKEKIEFGWREYIFGGINKLLGYPYKD
jgi:activator of HSP90 ATPase